MARTIAWKTGKRAAVLAALTAGNTHHAACEAVGLGRSTFYEWIAADEEFAAAVLRAEAEAENACVEAIRQGALKNWRAAAWWLERRYPKEWGRKDVLRSEHTGPGGGAIEITYVNDWRNISPEGNGPGRDDPPALAGPRANGRSEGARLEWQ